MPQNGLDATQHWQAWVPGTSLKRAWADTHHTPLWGGENWLLGSPYQTILDDSPTKHYCSTFKNYEWDPSATAANSFCLQSRHSFLARHSPLPYFPGFEELLNPMHFNRVQGTTLSFFHVFQMLARLSVLSPPFQYYYSQTRDSDAHDFCCQPKDNFLFRSFLRSSDYNSKNFKNK